MQPQPGRADRKPHHHPVQQYPNKSDNAEFENAGIKRHACAESPRKQSKDDCYKNPLHQVPPFRAEQNHTRALTQRTLPLFLGFPLFESNQAQSAAILVDSAYRLAVPNRKNGITEGAVAFRPLNKAA
jgi:hypothetical protein